MGMKRNRFMVGIIIVTFMLCCCSCRQEEETDDESLNQETMEGVSEESTIEETTTEEPVTGEFVMEEPAQKESVLESFSKFYGGLLEEGRAEELEPYVISRPLSQDEIIALGEYETLSYFKELGAGEYNARSVTVLEADLDGDGKKDILEYDLENCIPDLLDTNSLTLYRMDEDDFAMMYSQPRFEGVGKVLAVRYEGEVFLLFITGSDVTYSETDIYWFREWQLVGKCNVFSACHVEEEEKTDGEINAFVERYDGNSGITRETDGETVHNFWSWNGQMFQSDINNDGIMEMYEKRAGTSQQYDPSGLGYYMESGGRETDFMDMCGLDIWEGELIPIMFWVEEADGRNLTFLLYQSANEWSFEIAGYDIDGGQYTEILKVKGHEVVESTYDYEWKEEGESGSVPYGVRMVYDDIEHVVLYGMEDEEKQERINRKIEEWIRKEIETGSLKEHYADRIKPAQYTLYRATEEELVVKYGYAWYDKQLDTGLPKTCWFLVNLNSESCTETEGVGRYEIEDNLW